MLWLILGKNLKLVIWLIPISKTFYFPVKEVSFFPLPHSQSLLKFIPVVFTHLFVASEFPQLPLFLPSHLKSLCGNCYDLYPLVKCGKLRKGGLYATEEMIIHWKVRSTHKYSQEKHSYDWTLHAQAVMLLVWFGLVWINDLLFWNASEI